MRKKKISPKVIHFIKLGKGSKWADECLSSNIVKFGYSHIDHKWCKNEEWEKVTRQLTKHRKKEKKPPNKGVITHHTNILKKFYDMDENSLWVTIIGDHLWWCSTKKEIKTDSNNNKIRKTIEPWSNKDIKGNPLHKDRVSTAITQITRSEWTINSFSEKQKERLLNLINCEKSASIIDLVKSRDFLKKKIIPVVVDLHWKDFEILIDLIFRQGGWFRQKAIGGTEETIDLSLYSPITNERIAVQIKTQSNLNEFKKYEKKFRKMKSYDKKFYVVHTMDKHLMKYSPSKGIFLWTDEKVAEQIINLGLVEWLIEKAA